MEVPLNRLNRGDKEMVIANLTGKVSFSGANQIIGIV